MKKNIMFLIYSCLLGLGAGTTIWLFLRLLNLFNGVLWNFIPNHINLSIYPVIICLIGGIILGLFKRKYGDYPKKLEEVKNQKEFPLLPIVGGTFICLLIGSSVGPEAGLVSIVIALSKIIVEKLKKFNLKLNELDDITFSLALNIIFLTPFYSIINDSENNGNIKIPKITKTMCYIMTSIVGIFIYYILNKYFGKGLEMPTFTYENLTNLEILKSLILVIIGTLLGILYMLSDKLFKYLFSFLKNNILISCAIGGLILGITIFFIPEVIGSGDEQINSLINNYTNYTLLTLLIISFAKILITAFCINSGLKGGHFIPLIMAGVSIGFAFSIILNIPPNICIAVICASLFGYMMRKPLAVTALLFLCFPLEYLIWIFIAASLSNLFPKIKSA